MVISSDSGEGGCLLSDSRTESMFRKVQAVYRQTFAQTLDSTLTSASLHEEGIMSLFLRRSL